MATNETSELNQIDYWRTVIRKALVDCSTTDFHDLSEAAVDNMALVAAQAVVADLTAGTVA
jgi:hypothetical protein